jgi:predicted TIM-barrel fold metal-dependent hydrolase
MAVRMIDPWVNVSMGGGGQQPEWLIRVQKDYFRAGDEFLADISQEKLLADMDAAGVEKAILSIPAKNPEPRVLEFARAHPERFAYAVSVDPRKLMRELWRLEELVRSQPVAMARVVPFLLDLTPTHPVYYPLYAKCVELDLPLSINTGIPGPPMPGECQNPMYLDRVCLDFPQLKLCMAHGADPWWGVAIRLMLKYRNLHLMTSAYAPKYLPPDLLHFMNTRGQDKILCASDHPVLPMGRVVREAQDLDLRPGVLDKYLYANAERLFFSERKPRY